MGLANAITGLCKPRSVQDALEQLVKPSIVREIVGTCNYPGEVIEKVAKFENYNSMALLNEVATVLGLKVRQNVHLPSIELLETVALPRATLRKRLIVPQENESEAAKPILVAPDISLEIAKFHEIDSVQLCLCSELIRVWNDLDSLSLRCEESKRVENKLLVILQRLVRDAKSYGAREVFLGVPNIGEYEFISNGQVYRGKVTESIMEDINRRLGVEKRLYFSLTREKSGSDIEISKATGGRNMSFVVRIISS